MLITGLGYTGTQIREGHRPAAPKLKSSAGANLHSQWSKLLHRPAYPLAPSAPRVVGHSMVMFLFVLMLAISLPATVFAQAHPAITSFYAEQRAGRHGDIGHGQRVYRCHVREGELCD